MPRVTSRKQLFSSEGSLAISEQVPILIQRLLDDTLNATKYAKRQGSAYGLGGAIKGHGMTCIQEFSIVNRLRDALEDKKNSRARAAEVREAIQDTSREIMRGLYGHAVKLI
ncbi:hypothetical protein PCANC_23861 [Puccinia coronata f. sp. avenae]|uniref:Uncharacterized protein n=1 Tax=Puccinia coronata f. sp. avenae TaxID=200324 RepID=A0A2N5TN58_9BASI|nr:hypothetical protein PCANC_23861 [Puccinia coronata f. sp. avenae]PLW52033.1 hypothetical protein PCASD_02130 [Puccinia coronata f. sp. avenae]